MIVGIGVDVVDLARFERALDRTPALRSRLFTDDELLKDGVARPLRSLGGRFAAKEAFMKALGESTGVQWHDMRVVSNDLGNPSLVLSGAAASLAEAKGIAHVHLSMSHDAGVAIAYVIAERGENRPASTTYPPRESDSSSVAES
jgi:holo-[acyl-carrier protein] synthase